MKYLHHFLLFGHKKLLPVNNTIPRIFSNSCHSNLVSVLNKIMATQSGASDSGGAGRKSSHGQLYKNKIGNYSSLRTVKNRQRLNNAEKAVPASSIDIQVVGSGFPGTPRSLYIPVTLFSYLFNCGEGTQRACLANKMRVSKITDIFFTRRNWDNISGLLGLCLTMESMDVPGFKIHGPPDLVKSITSAGPFARLKKLVIIEQDLHKGSYEDSAMNIDYIILTPEGDPTDEPEAKKAKISNDDICVAYLFKPKPKRRNVDMEKCSEIGIKKGSMIGELTQNRSVTLEDGRVVHPEDILSPPLPNKCFLVLECATVDHLQSLLTHDKIRALSTDTESDDCPGIIVHMTPESVLKHPDYQAWIKRFPESTTHLVMNEKCSGLYIEESHKTQTILNMIHPRIFPLLPQQNTQVNKPDMPNVTLAEACLQYTVRGKNQNNFNRDSCITLDPDKYRQEALEDPDNAEAFNDLAQKLQKHDNTNGAQYPEFIFLGTGSSEPSKTRNVSAIWVNISPDKSVLLDCGENTLGQLIRHYGNKTDDKMAQLEAIFISHLHTDHHLGCLSMARYRRDVLRSRGLEPTKLVIVAPKYLRDWHLVLPNVSSELSGLNIFIPVRAFYKNEEPRKDVTELCKQLDMSSIESVHVRHAADPHGFVLTHSAGWKLVYSGDTMPSPELVNAGVGCDILIHEATMEDDMAPEAKKKRHSTASQAIQVGRDMQAKFILLTHFSQRYPKIPLFNDNFSEKVGIAFDHMRVRLGEVEVLPTLLPALKQVFSREYEDLKVRKQRRQWAAEGKNKNSKDTNSEQQQPSIVDKVEPQTIDQKETSKVDNKKTSIEGKKETLTEEKEEPLSVDNRVTVLDSSR